MDDEPGEPAPALPRRRKRELPWWVSIAVICVFLIAAGGLYYVAGLPKNGVHVGKLEADAVQALPPGSSEADIHAWLSTQGITEVGPLTDPGGKQIGVHALLPNDSWIDQAEIDIRMMFDATGKLSTFKIARYKSYQP